jgi:hypothetical protein
MNFIKNPGESIAMSGFPKTVSAILITSSHGKYTHCFYIHRLLLSIFGKFVSAAGTI